MRKGDRNSRANNKRSGSQKARQKARRGLQTKGKAARSPRKTARRVTMFKSTSWYQTAMASIAISPRVSP
jgi:hypothetical protein